MALILTIDTALETGIVVISGRDGSVYSRINTQQRDHASWVNLAIQDLLAEAQLKPAELDAVAVVAGPGSYTGVRVGLATAKGICFTTSVPLLLLNTLDVMVTAAARILKNSGEHYLLCPLIDARRMEVFTAVYDSNHRQVIEPSAMVIDEGSFGDQLAHNRIVFFGNGSEKLKKLITHSHAMFRDIVYGPEDLVEAARLRFAAGDFADTAYSEPFYLKEFYTPPAIKNR